jgi:chromosomal replication initiation ATPase DnaA
MGQEPGREASWDQRSDEAAHDRAKAAFVAYLVAMATGVSAETILVGRRAPGRAGLARAMALYLLHVGFALPQNRVAAAFQRDRTTICHACRRIEALRERADVDRALERLEACVRHAPAEIVA